MTTPTTTPAEYHAQLTANVDAWYADRIDHVAFHAAQRALWATIEASDCKDAVLALLRGTTTAAHVSLEFDEQPLHSLTTRVR